MLILEAPTRDLATRFLRGDGARALDQVSPVFARWSRSASLGVAAESEGFPHATSDSDLAVRRDRLAEVFREKRALLAPLAKQLSAGSLVALVADPEGVILASHGGGSVEDPAVRVRLVEGARWSEDVRGTNAIGTAIAERQPVAVIGAAHYELRNHGIFCYGHPIFDGYGDLVAVLDVTGPLAQHDRDVGSAVRTAAVSIEQSLRRLAYAQSGAGTLSAIERLIHRSSSATLLVEASGQVVVMNDLASRSLGLSESTRNCAELTCEKLFGLAFSDLHRLVVDGSPDLRFETATAAYRVELDPVNGARGRTFALVIHLEAVRSRGQRRQVASAEPTPPPLVAPPASSPSSRSVAAGLAAFEGILGSDSGLIAAMSSAARFARTPLPVLLLAETGTGKELFARAIHAASPRAAGPFVALNCGALASTVLESELFGYAPNSFTGASRQGADGKIMAAHGGTLFLDEIAEMPDALQATLLRVLDEGGAHYRVGDTRVRRSDFRLLCATCRDLPALVDNGGFRRDLFFRIYGACVTLPALRDREDCVELAEGLIARLTTEAGAPTAALAPSARAWLLRHSWPGNVRELKSAIIHALALADGGALEAEHFPKALIGLPGEAPEPPSSAPLPSARTRVAIINEAILDAVRASAGNVSEAARRLGIARSTVYRVLRGQG